VTRAFTEQQDKLNLRAVLYAVRVDGQEIVTGALGDSMTGLPARPDGYFPQRSVAEADTSTLLVDEGVVALDDRGSTWAYDSGELLVARARRDLQLLAALGLPTLRRPPRGRRPRSRARPSATPNTLATAPAGRTLRLRRAGSIRTFMSSRSTPRLGGWSGRGQRGVGEVSSPASLMTSWIASTTSAGL
jgi:hypothetical protein